MKLCILTGIFPPIVGGPATFADTFLEWSSTQENIDCKVVTLTSEIEYESNRLYKNKVVKIYNRDNIILRMAKTIREIIRLHNQGFTFLANGLFIEVFIASLIKPISFVSKLPGDVVWERATTKGRTSLNIIDFQKSKLRFADLLHRKLINSNLRKAKKIICPTNQIKDICTGWGTNPAKILVIPNGVNASSYCTVAIEKDIDLLCVNRLVPWKNVDQVIEAASKLNLNLTIAGEGPSEKELRNLARKLNARVNFLGAVDKNELVKLYNRAKIYILNSSFELTAYSLIEAQLCGIFSIANGNTGSSDVIQSGLSGILLSDSKSISIIKALENLNVEDVTSASSMEYIRKMAIAKFDSNKIFERLVNAIATS